MRPTRTSKLGVLSAVGATALALALPLALPANAAPQDSAPWGQVKAQVDAGYALVNLTGAPLSTSPRTKPAKGKKINFSNTTVKSEQARLTAERNTFKKWLQTNYPKAQVTKEFDLALNGLGVKLNGTNIDALKAGPGVTYVEPEAIFQPLAGDDPQLAMIRGIQAWQSVGGSANAGKGVKVGVLDTGIDISHPCFDDAGYPATTQLGDKRFTNNKVIVARVYGNTVAKQNEDNTDNNGHGTHVAGTIACNANTPAVIDGVTIPYSPSGVAPRAQLGSYKVLLSEGGRSEDIIEGMQDAYKDGMDVINMSLGGGMQSGSKLTMTAVDNLDQANLVVAVAAGNEGPGYWTVHYPGAAERALTAGATSVGHTLVNQLVVGANDYDMVVGEFAALNSDITAPLKVVADPASAYPHGLSLACNGQTLPNLTGTIAVIGRGDCTFGEKMSNTAAAGALATVVVDRAPGGLTLMANSGVVVNIPGVFVSLADGLELKTMDGQTATLKSQPVYKTFPEITNLMAGFSSQGPVPGSLLVKPDVVAPGAQVLSSQPSTMCASPPCWAFFNGTSMATPHLAGIAALVRQAHPDWSAAQVRSAVVNTAKTGILRDPITGAVTNDGLIVGAGLADAVNAIGAKVTLEPVSLSYGSISSGSGRSVAKSITVTNTTSATRTLVLSVANDAADGVTYSVSSASITLAAGASATVPVTVTTAKGTPDGFYQAKLVVSSGGSEIAHGVLFTSIGAGVGAPGQHSDPPKVGQQ